MRGHNLLGSCLVALLSISSASDVPSNHILYGDGPTSDVAKGIPRTRLALADACINSPQTRHCWRKGYSINTDFDRKWPTTGKTVSYNFEITNTTCNPDGTVSRPCMLINDQLPGPTVRANWGDYIEITVTNKMQHNGTSIHWHGIRQLYTVAMDGVNGITECPIAPGYSKTYRFQATQFGTSWYHSHFSVQYGDGVSGPIVIEGPASANYDYDMGPVALSDWFYQTAWQISSLTNALLQKGKPGPPADTFLINGKNKNREGDGFYSEFTMIPGKKHRFRFVNTAVDNFMRVSIDNHTMEVISADFTPLKPFQADSVMLGAGQRYDVIVTADQPVGNYWMRVVVEKSCGSFNLYKGNAIVRYDGASEADPTSTSSVTDKFCDPPGALVPWVYNSAGSEKQFKAQAERLAVDVYPPGTATNKQNIVLWGINMTGIDVQWRTPTLAYVMKDKTDYPTVENLIETPSQNMWTYWIIQEVASGGPPIPHPMHLHGHDFYILAAGNGTFNRTTDMHRLNFSNPPRRDTGILPAGGWMIMAFETDNPGAWLMHCHIAWHVSEGLGVQFLSNTGNITVPEEQFNRECDAWNDYAPTALYQKQDSGV